MDYSKVRETMVEQQVRPWNVLDPAVLEAINAVPREDFVAPQYRALAYTDMELPLGHGEIMCKPVFEGRQLQALDLQPTDTVLEIGSGSGYLAACLGKLVREVIGLERHADLAAASRERLDAAGIGNVAIEAADAFAWNTERRFDAICVSGAVDVVPERFVGWLRPGGRLFVVHGRSPAMQAVLLRNDVHPGRIESLFETDLPYLAGAAPVPEFKL